MSLYFAGSNTITTRFRMFHFSVIHATHILIQVSVFLIFQHINILWPLCHVNHPITWRHLHLWRQCDRIKYIIHIILLKGRLQDLPVTTSWPAFRPAFSVTKHWQSPGTGRNRRSSGGLVLKSHLTDIPSCPIAITLIPFITNPDLVPCVIWRYLVLVTNCLYIAWFETLSFCSPVEYSAF